MYVCALVCHPCSNIAHVNNKNEKEWGNKWAVEVFFHMTNFTPQSDWYTPGNPVSHFKMSDSLTETGLIYILFDTSVYCLKAWILSLWSKSLCTTFVILKNKIWLDEIKTAFLISSNRKRAYGCEWSGEFVPKITLTWLDRLMKLFCIRIVCVSVSSLQYAHLHSHV